MSHNPVSAPSSYGGTNFEDAVLLVNSKSLNGKAWFEDAKVKLAESGLLVSAAESFADPRQLVDRAKTQAREGRLLIVGGGDGTISSVVNAVAKTGVTLGLLPLGTGNAFARDLSIPTDLDKAIEIMVNGKETRVDLGVSEGCYFLNVATVGLSATVAKTLTIPLKRRFGRFVYAIAWAKALREMRGFRTTIATENGNTDMEALQIVVGNGKYHAGPLPISRTASITDGLLHLYAVDAKSRGSLIKYALLLPTGFQGSLDNVHSEDTEAGAIITTPVQSVVVDGEVSQKTPLRFSIDPLALRVMTPESFQG